MANPDVPAALVVLQAHLVAAGGALTDPLLDVDRGLLTTRGRALRYYWAGEANPAEMGASQTLTSELVGQRFIIAASWPLTDVSEELVTALDVEMQLLAAQIRTRIDGDSTLGGTVTDLTLGYCEPDIATIANARHIILTWELSLAFIEYTVAP